MSKRRSKEDLCAGVDDDFHILAEDSNTVASAPADDIHHLTDSKLDDHNIYPDRYPKEWKNRDATPGPISIRFKVTYTDKAEKFLKKFELWYIKHQMGRLTASNATVELWKAALIEDPVGAMPVDQEDDQYYKATRVGKKIIYSKRDFLVQLERFQERNYLFYRASIKKFLCDTCNSVLTTWITNQEQNHTPVLDKINRLDKGKRITWKSMRAFILTLTVNTLGSYYFLTLFKVVRRLDEGFHAWCDNIRKVNAKIRKHGKGWEKVCERESLHTIKAYISRAEHTVLLDHLAFKRMRKAYPTLNDVADKINMDTFMTTFGDVNHAKLPKTFPLAAQKEGMKRNLVGLEEIQKLKQAVADKDNVIKQLRGEIKTLKADNGHHKTKNKILESNMKDLKNSSEHNKGVTIGKHGKAKAGHCQLCKNAGLGNRKHKGPCDPKRRADAVASLNAKKQSKGGGKKEKPQQQARKHKLSSYESGDCEHCIREDVPPKYATGHPPNNCYRRPNGPLDQKGIKDPRKRSAEIGRLINEAQKKREARDKKNAKTRVVVKQKKVRIAVTKRSKTKKKGHGDTDIAEGDAEGPDPLYRERTDYVKGYYLSKYAKENPLTEKEIEALIPDPERRHQRGQVEVIMHHYERDTHEREFRSFREKRKRQRREAEDRLAEKRSKEPSYLNFRKSTLYVGGYYISKKALVQPLSREELKGLLSKKDMNDPIAIARTRRRYEESNNLAEERLAELRARNAPLHSTASDADIPTEYTPSAPTHVPDGAPKFAPQNPTNMELYLKCSQYARRNVELARQTDIAHSLVRNHDNKDLEEAFEEAQQLMEEDDYADNREELANRIYNIESWDYNLKFQTEQHLRHMCDFERKNLSLVRKLELQNRIHRILAQKKKLMDPERYKLKPVYVPMISAEQEAREKAEQEREEERKRTTKRAREDTDNSVEEEGDTKRTKPDSPQDEHVGVEPSGSASPPNEEAFDSHMKVKSPQYNPTSPLCGSQSDRSEYEVSDAQHERSDSDEDCQYSDDSKEVTCNAHARTYATSNASAPPLERHERLEWPTAKKRRHVYAARVRRRKAFYQELFTDVLDLPDELWCPASLRARPIARAYVSKSKRKANDMNTRHGSEIRGNRLLQSYVTYRAPDGSLKKGRVELDTMSNVNYAAPGVTLPRKLRAYEARKVKGISNQTVRLGKPTAFTLMRHDKPVVIDTVKAPKGMFDDGCIALLGLDAIAALGIDMNALIAEDRHVDIKFLNQSDELLRRARADAIERYPLQKRFERYMYKKTFLSERICAEYLKEHPNDYASTDILKDSIDIAPHLSAEERARILQLLHQYGEVFAQKTNTLPKPMKGVKPHVFKLKEDHTPTRTGRPKFGPAQAKIITDWVEWASSEAVGLIEPANTTSWSSRLILAPKYKGNTPKSALPDGIRVAWAGVSANEQIQKTVPTYPDAWEQMYKVANYKYKFSADGLKQYWSIPLDEKSREVTAFWTPLGLYQFTRLVMGTKNAATVAQNAYTHALHTMLHKDSFEHIANFADDFLGGADTVDSLLEHFEGFLKMCKKAGITLNPQKIRIGYEKEQFFGLTIDNGKIEPAERNLDPVKKMTAPQNRSELRSVMGVFDQFSSFIKDYGKEGSPASILNSLRSPKVPWDFTEKHEKAIEELKQQILSGVHLYAPNNDHPLILETDGSEDGWGAILYQVINEEKRVIKMWSRRWKTEAWIKKPPYHREAKAWMNGLTLAIPYALYNKHPVQCYTDHTPLTWIKHTSGKGPVSQFIVDNLSVVDYEMHYIKGPDNIVADGLSRFPLLGPSVLRREGLSEALEILLAALTGTNVSTDKVWFYTGKDTKHMVADLYDWRDQVRKDFPHFNQLQTPRCYMDLFSVSNVQRLEYTLGIWAPAADKITAQCRAAFLKGRPFACLVPNDLVCFIATDSSKNIIHPVQKQVDEAMKITLLSPGLTWIIHGVDFSSKTKIRTVHASKRVTPDFELDDLVKHLKDSNLTPPLPHFATRQDWIAAQKKERCALIYEGTPGVYEAADGLLVIETAPGGPLRTIVPTTMTIDLATWQHQNLCHLGYQKILSVLKKKFYWKNMRRTCQHVVKTCALCNLLKARMKLAHKHFRAKLFCTPRTSYGADYYAVQVNKEGFCQILGIIDLANGHLVLAALKDRTAANTAHVLFYEIVNRKGVPRLFHTDAAKEFLSTAMKALSATLGIVQTNTLAHNPKSNAKIERVWQFVGNCLKAMTPAQYAKFHMYTPIMAHVWNTVPDTETGITPFEAEHGMKCRSVLDCIVENPPKEGLPAAADDLRTIAVSVNAFTELIKNVKAVEKVQTAQRLNQDGTSKIQYKVGDKVGFFLPPNQDTAKLMHKKKKHILHYTGPGEIVESLSSNGTSWKILYKGRHYERNVVHLRHYTADDEVPAALQIAHDDSIWVGSYVAVIDDEDSVRYHLAQVIDINDQETTLHYLATKSRQLRSARWQKLYHHPGSGQVVTDQPQNLIRNWMRFTGMIPTQSREDSLIIQSNIGFTDQMRVNKTSRDMLSRLPYTHHMLGRTWHVPSD